MRRIFILRVAMSVLLLAGLVLAAWFIQSRFPAGFRQDAQSGTGATAAAQQRISGPEALARVLTVASMGVSDFALQQHIRPKVVGVHLTTKRLAPWWRGATLSTGQGVPDGAPVWVVRIRVPWDTRIGDGRMRRGVVYRRRKMLTGTLEVHVDARHAGRGVIFVAPWRTPPGPLITRVEIAFMALRGMKITAPWGRGRALAGPTLDEALLRKNGPSDRTQLLGYANRYVRPGSPDTWVWRVRVKGPFRVEAGSLPGAGPRRSRTARWATIDDVSWFLDARRLGRGTLGSGFSMPTPVD